MELKTFKSALLMTTTAFALVACGDSSTDLSTPNNPTPPATDNGGTGGGNAGGGTGGGSTDACPTGTSDAGDGTCAIPAGELTSDLTLPGDTVYSLSDRLIIGVDAGADTAAAAGTPATLTIGAGATIVANNPGTTIVVARGSDLVVNGTQTNPVTMTSADGYARSQNGQEPSLDEGFTSEWGGLVINGRATLNNCTDGSICTADGEGDSGQYGGNDDEDSSGSIRYLRVLYAGNLLTSNDELNGIAFQGVGSGTIIENLQVHNGADDGVEFFGGTVNIRNLIVTGSDDDSIDWTFGWRGKIQNALVIQNPNQAGSDRGIEADNFEFGLNNLPRSAPIISNFTNIGAGPVVGDSGFVLRRGTAAQIYNTVATGWADDCFDIDGAETFDQIAAGGIDVQSVLFDCASPFDGGDDFDADVETFVLGRPNVTIGASSLATRDDSSSFAYINGEAENAVPVFDVATVDSFFTTPTAIGAVASASSQDDFTLGWAVGLGSQATCPAGTTAAGEGACILEGTVTGDVRLVAGLDYFLRGQVVVGEDAGADATAPNANAATGTLTIDAGVVIQGEDPGAALVVSRGSQLFSNGTRNRPVVFTALNPETRSLDTDTSLWGGLVINGRATLNNCTDGGICTAEGEGDSGEYGGNDDADNSGRILFTRVEYAGNLLTSNDELNGIAFQGVGAGTEIDYLQVHNGADDGVEFFGGTVNVKHLVITGSDDDSIDWTFGWRGMLQHVIVKQNPNQAGSDRGIEADNFEFGLNNLPRSAPVISNFTNIGAADQAIGDSGFVLRRGTAAQIYNTVATNWADDCFDIDGTETFDQIAAGGIDVQSVLFDCASPFDGGDDFDGDVETFVLGRPNVTIGASSLTGAGATVKYINGANETAVTAFDASTVNSFFDSVNYIGAVPSSANDWTAGWTVYLDR